MCGAGPVDLRGSVSTAAAAMPETGARVVKTGNISGTSFGDSAYTLFEAGSDATSALFDDTYLFVFLHGLDGYQFPLSDAVDLQKRLCMLGT